MIISAAADSIRVAKGFDRADAGLVEELRGVPVALLGDCFQRLGVMQPEIRPVTPHAAMAGGILPILCREGDNLAIHRALDEVQAGDVLVIDGFGETGRALFGGILGEACLALGVGGVVVDGSVRDVEELTAIGVPVYARGVTPAGPYKNGPGTVGLAVACGGIVCHPGDAIFGDRDGIVVIPAEQLGSARGLLHEQIQVEALIRSRIPSLRVPSE